MMDEFENNRENEHVDQTPHAETPYDTGDGNTDNLKRTEQQTEQNAEHRQEDAYTQAQQYGSTYYGDMRTQEYMQAMAERAQQMSRVPSIIIITITSSRIRMHIIMDRTIIIRMVSRMQTQNSQRQR